MLDYIILGFLLHGDMTGYDIKQFMAHSTAYFYDASFGSIYPMLKKLEGSGLITSMESVEGGKFRKEYSLTDQGRHAFLKWLNEPIELGRGVYTHLVKIFFYGWMPPEKAAVLIQEYIVKMQEELNSLDELSEKIKGYSGFYEASTLDFGREYYTFAIIWCKNFIEKLNRLHDAGELNERCIEQ
jgi:DNA-binding PadR family transcriptional regulator